LTHDYFVGKLEETVTKFDLEIPQTDPLTNLRYDEDLFQYLEFAKKANKCLELFRMKLSDRFTQVHLWPNCFDLSVEWFTMKNNEQIGVGISPGDDDYESPYLYVNPYPFDEKMVDRSLAIGK
jgi:hypothetical protein